ncbi:IST1-like protein [Cryptotermes secundus]|uniref:IST1 homolog n=1 Tax=Cryptotermes secundus TaxID=105785 RepID=A0A2J7R9E2_9NEOP|nr:IST1 homolog isoform X2 [Cryptotermes secundus]PNF37460.1 IST1-like protein [Cryptotermes secundus]
MFSSGPNYTKLKTNLRLAINRLKLLEKKKTELAQKARKEIADYISAGKYERAKIRVEHIIREDYMVEAMEVVEMYCDLLLARFGLIEQMKTLDEGLAEAISSLMWVAPRLQTDVAELKVIADLLMAKYGRQYSDACREEAVTSISEKLKHKMSVQSPPKLLVEKYLIEIAKNYNIEYEPDPQVMKDDPQTMNVDSLLIDVNSDKNNLDGGSVLRPQPPGFIGYPQPPMLPQQPSDFQPFNYPIEQKIPSLSAGGPVAPPQLPAQAPKAPFGFSVPFSYNIPPGNDSVGTGFNAAAKPLNTNLQSDDKPKPLPRSKLSPNGGGPNQLSKKDGGFFDLPELPSVPTDSLPPPDEALDPGNAGNDEIDFDDLTRRFEDLKKKK